MKKIIYVLITLTIAFLAFVICLQYLKKDVKRLSTINKCLKEKGYGIEFVE